MSVIYNGKHPNRLNAITTHGMAYSREYRSWASMKQRCENPNHKRFSDWGGRGISVCDRWQRFENFISDMGPRPEGHSIDREDNDGNYEPGNCRWATRSQQQKNRRNFSTENLPRGENHWTKQDPDRARIVARKNIKASHGNLEQNNNAKMTLEKAAQMRADFKNDPSQKLEELGAKFGVKRETTRKVVRGLLS